MFQPRLMEGQYAWICFKWPEQIEELCIYTYGDGFPNRRFTDRLANTYRITFRKSKHFDFPHLYWKRPHWWMWRMEPNILGIIEGGLNIRGMG